MKIPTWDEADRRVREGFAGAIDRFVQREEPAGSEQEEKFRAGLQAVVDEAEDETLSGDKCIPLTAAEIQSGLDRVRWAELLIRQLPEDHEGRNTWLLNYGKKAG